MKIPVIIIDAVFAHYRKDFFTELKQSADFDFNLITGDRYIGIKSVSDEKNIQLDYLNFRIFGHTFYYLKGILKFILKKRAPIIISTGVDFHLIHILLLFFINKIFIKSKFYWWSHASIGNQGNIGYILRKFFYKNSDGVLVYSKAGEENLLRMGIKKERIEVVGNSINYFDYGYLNYNISRNYNKRNELKILYTGRITKEKKLDILIRAIAVLKSENKLNIKCMIVGGGAVNKLIRLAEDLNVIGCVDFIGPKYEKDIHQYFIDADLFVYPGGIGLSVLHALSFGIPVITTDNIQLQFPEFELLKKGYNGDLYKDNSVEDLAGKILEWEDKIKKSKNEISTNCIQRIKDLEYLPDKMSFKFQKLLKRTKD